MNITPIQNLPKIPAPWTIPVRRTEPVEGSVSGAVNARVMVADQAAVPMIETKRERSLERTTASTPEPTEGARTWNPASANEARVVGDGARSEETPNGPPRQRRLPPEGIQL